MKILMICDFYDEGLEFQENLLSKYYNKFNHEVTIVTSTYENVFDFYESRGETKKERVYTDKYGSKVFKKNYKFNLLNKIRPYSGLLALVEEIKPDVIFVHSFLPDLLTVRNYVRKNNIKLIVDLHMDYVNSAKNAISIRILHGLLRKFMYKYVENDIHRLFVVAESVKKFVSEVYRIPTNKMELLPLGADTDFIEQLKSENVRQALRKKYKINSDDIVIFCGGKLNPLKKIDLAIETYLKLSQRNLKLIVVGESGKGDSEYYEKLRKLSENRSDIIFTGWLNKEEVYSHLLASDIGFFPCSQSILWQQAIASGLPLVVGLSREDEKVDYLNCNNSLIIHSKENVNITSYYSTLERLIEDQDLLLQMKASAEKTGRELLCWNKMVEQSLA